MSATYDAASQYRVTASPVLSLDQIKYAFEKRLAELLPSSGNPGDLLTEAMQYAVLGGGKRLRPMLFLSIVRDLGHNAPALFDLAGAIEIMHAASLILDDLPCMDDAKLRRAQATVHIKYGEDIAMLAAVALLSHAFHIVACAKDVSANARICFTSILAQAIGAQGLAKGQYQDLHHVPQRPVADVARTYALKTGALLGVAIEMATTVAQTSAETTQSLRQFAAAAGQAFQIRDDLLDVGVGPAAAEGEINSKDIGQDARKATLPSTLGIVAAHLRMVSEATQAYFHLDVALGPHNQTRSLLAALFPQCDARNIPAPVND